MTVSDFFNKYNGKGINFDGYYGNQCVDLYQQYNREVVGAPSIPNAQAKLVWNNYPIDYYSRFLNTPDAVPQAGDVIIWGAMPGNSAGHIAVFQKGDVWNFTSFDQNYPSQGYYSNGVFIGTGVCHFQAHNYSYVIGWLRPKKPVVEKFISSLTIKAIVDGPGSDGDKLIAIRKLL